MVELLLDRGADLEAKADFNSIHDGRITALHLAAKNGDMEVLRLLLDRGADLAAKTGRGWTALHLAAFWDKEKAVEILLKWGADPTAKDNLNRTALNLAEQGGCKEVAKLLRANASLARKVHSIHQLQ